MLHLWPSKIIDKYMLFQIDTLRAYNTIIESNYIIGYYY